MKYGGGDKIFSCGPSPHALLWSTGGSSGIGKSAAIMLAKLGANITILARTTATYCAHSLHLQQLQSYVIIDALCWQFDGSC